jgi:hypothetical protein
VSGWIKLSTSWADDPKILQAGPEASLLYLEGLAYAGRHNTGGHVPAAVVPLFPFPASSKAKTIAAGRLVEAGLWTENGTGYSIASWDRWQTIESRADPTAADRMRRYRQRKRLRDGTDHELRNESYVEESREDQSRADLDLDLDLSSTVGVDPEGGSGGEPDVFDTIDLDGQIDERFGAVLTPDQRHNLGRLCRSNRAFLDVWPGMFEGQDKAVVTEALMRARNRDVGDVGNPRAWLEALLGEVSAGLPQSPADPQRGKSAKDPGNMGERSGEDPALD